MKKSLLDTSQKKIFSVCVFFLFIIFSLKAQQSQTANGVLIEMDAPNMLSTCSDDVIHVTLTNNSGSIISAYDFEFLNNLKIDILYSSITDPRITKDVPNKKIAVSDLQTTEVFEFDIPIRANCSNSLNTTNSVTVETLKIRPVATAAADFDFNLNVESGYLVYLVNGSTNLSYVGHKNDIFTREHSFRNTASFALNGYLYFEEFISEVKIRSLSLQIGSNTPTVVVTNPVVDINGKVIQTIPLTNIPSNIDVKIIEEVEVIGCPNTQSGILSLGYGCSNDFCKNYTPTNLILTIQPDITQRPHAHVFFSSPIQEEQTQCISNNDNTREITVTNDGTLTAEELIVHFKAINDNTKVSLLLVDNASFTIDLSGALGVTYSFNTNTTKDIDELKVYFGGVDVNYLCSFSSGTRFIVQKDIVFHNFKVGDIVKITYTENACCTDEGIGGGYEFYRPRASTTYKWDCLVDAGGATYASDFSIKNMNMIQTQGITDMFGCISNCGLSDLNTNSQSDNTENITLAIDDFMIKRDNGEFSDLGSEVTVVFDLAADGNLMLAPQLFPGGDPANHGGLILFNSVTGATISPIPGSIQYLTKAQLLDKFAITDLPPTDDDYMGVRVAFSIPLDPRANCYTAYSSHCRFLQLTELMNILDLKFQVSAMCGRTSSNTGEGHYYIRSFFALGSSCADCYLPIGERIKGIRVNCPGCTYPGVITNSYQIQRKTFGFKDEDNNGLPDDMSLIQEADLSVSNANAKMVTDHDVFATISASQLWPGTFKTYGKGSNIGTIETETAQGFSPRFLNNICRVDQIAPYGNFFEMEVSTNYPIKLKYMRNGVELFPEIVLTNNTNNIVSTDNNGQFLFQFPLSLVRAITGMSTLNIEADDQFYITAHYKVKPDFAFADNIYYENIDISTACFMSGNDQKDITVPQGNPQSPFGFVGSYNATQFSSLTPDMNYLCEAFGNTFILADIKKSFKIGDYPYAFFIKRENCTQSIESGFNVNGAPLNDFSRQQGKLDLFPFEVRNLNTVNNFRFIVPKGFSYSSANIYSMTSMRNINELSFGLLSLKKDAVANLVTVNYIDPNNTADGVLGDLYEIVFPVNTSPFYNTDPSIFQNLNSSALTLDENSAFNDCNEFIEQIFTVDIVPSCASNELPEGIIAIMDDPSPIQRYTMQQGGIDRVIPEAPYANILSFNPQENEYGTVETLINATEVWGQGVRKDIYPPTITNLDISSSTNNITINQKDQLLSFTVSSPTTESDNVFLYMTSTNNQFAFGDLTFIDGNGVAQTKQLVNGAYQLGRVPANGSLTFQVQTNYICDASGNTSALFTLNYGFNCEGYPTIVNGAPTESPCLLMHAPISVNLANAFSDVLRYQIIDGATGCDSKNNILRIKSLGTGNVYTDHVRITLPPGLTYKSNSSRISVVDGTGAIINDDQSNPLEDLVLPEPSLVSDELVWDLIDWNKWDKFPSALGNEIILEFETNVSCLYIGGNVQILTDQVTYCLEDADRSLNYSIPGTTSLCTPVIGTLDGPSHICIDNNATINYQINNSLGNSDTYHLTWYINSSIVEEEDRTISSYPFIGSKSFDLDAYTSATIQLAVMSSGGCSSTTSVMVTVDPMPTITMVLPVEFCLNTTPLTLTASPSGGTFSGTGVSGNQYNPTLAGNHVITYTYVAGACTATATDEIEASPCCPYRLNPVSPFCGTNQTYCLQIEAVRAVDDGIKGMDFVIRYNSAQVTPVLTSGIINATYGTVVLNGLNSSQVGHSSSIQIPHASDPDPDKVSTTRDLHVSIFYKSTAPSSADWNGIGNVICLEFEINAPVVGSLSPFKIGVLGIPPNHNTLSIGNTDEEYSLATVTQCVENGGIAPVTIIQNPTLTGIIRFHNTSDVLKYNAANPAQFNETLIQPTSDINSNCTAINAANNTYPNLSGQFSVNMTGAAAVRFNRDIDGDYSTPNCTTSTNAADVLSVMTSFNGYDSYLMESITTLRDPQSMTLNADAGVPNPNGSTLSDAQRKSTFPSPYQMIAADVNVNGRVRANDITWLQQRAVSQICEFPQAWNYTENGNSAVPNSPGLLSYDWRFTNKTGVRSTDYPYIGATMSTDKFDGYWRDAVPAVDNCIEFTATPTSCTRYPGTQEVYAVLLGDLDGSWRPNTSAQANLKVASNKAVVLDYANMVPTGNNTYRIPVAFNSDETTVSLDFVLNYDESKIQILSIGNLQEATDKNARVVSNDFNHSQLLFSSYTMSDYDPNADIFYVEVMSLTGDMKASYLGSGAGFLNGKKVLLAFNGAATTPVIEDQSSADYGFNVIPNPNNGTGSIHYNVETDANAKIVIYNAIGQIVREYTNINGNGSIELTSNELGAGMYQVILYKNAHDTQVKKMMVYK